VADVDFYIKQGRKHIQAFPYKGLNEGVMVIGAVRYALGRASYSPSCVMEFCQDNWSDLERNTRHVIMRDVLEWLGERHEWVKEGEHDMAWPDDWRKFLRWCFAQGKEEAKAASDSCLWRRDRMQGVDEFFGEVK